MKRKKIPGWPAGCWLGAYQYMSGLATHKCAYDAPSLHRPKVWAGEATNSETSC